MKKRLTMRINFRQEYAEVYHYLKSKENASSYLCQLVLKDINARKEGEFRDELIQEIRQIVSGHAPRPAPAKPLEVEEHHFDESMIAGF